MSKLPKFLITTHKTLSLFDGKNLTDVYKRPNTLFFGITWNKDCLFVLSRNAPGKPESLLTFDKKFNLINETKLTDFAGGHQIYYDSNFYFMNSNKKQITYWDAKSKKRAVNWPEADWATHINSVWNFPGTMYYYVIEHNGGNPPSNLCLCRFIPDFKLVKRYKNIGLHAHNIHWDKERTKFTTLSSMEFCIKEFIRDKSKTEDLVESKRKQINALGSNKWYLRGLGRTLKHWIIGLSMHQEMLDPDPIKRRNERRNLQNGGVIILDNDWNAVHEIEINNRGQIHDLRVISEIDQCHNGILF